MTPSLKPNKELDIIADRPAPKDRSIFRKNLGRAVGYGGRGGGSSRLENKNFL